jgi:murein DD-endopeptidase MepM/ murein hydrolase activator NlpD/SH3-like domain-containing protein
MSYLSYLKKNIAVFLLITMIAASCTTSGPAGIFGKKSPHEQYEDKIKNAGLQETAMGKLWLSAAEQSLTSPLSINLPYSETGYFAADQPKAAGLLFHAKRGEKVTVNLSKKPATGFAVYLDLWQPAPAADAKAEYLLSADTATATITYEVNKEGSYILRLQPELLKGGEYTLSISTEPSLAFPVTPKVKSSIGSFWGAGRDRGVRKHEGIDIFGPRGTALVAAADGVVTSVTENVLGGKVVFLRPDNKDFTLYYAHLDQQLVEPGQPVKTGDTIGLMGNTGNARTTSPHLHFGIYTNSGAIDPLPFVDRATKMPGKISAQLSNIGNWVKNNKAIKMFSAPTADAQHSLNLESNTLLKADAATGSWYKVSLPDGEKGFVISSAITAVSSPVRQVSLKTEQPLLDGPNDIAARKTTLLKGEPISILAVYKDFFFVKDRNNKEGWISKKAL